MRASVRVVLSCVRKALKLSTLPLCHYLNSINYIIGRTSIRNGKLLNGCSAIDIQQSRNTQNNAATPLSSRQADTIHINQLCNQLQLHSNEHANRHIIQSWRQLAIVQRAAAVLCSFSISTGLGHTRHPSRGRSARNMEAINTLGLWKSVSAAIARS